MSWKIAPLGETRQLFMGETPKTLRVRQLFMGETPKTTLAHHTASPRPHFPLPFAPTNGGSMVNLRKPCIHQKSPVSIGNWAV
jgi:hypothetical protein